MVVRSHMGMPIGYANEGRAHFLAYIMPAASILDTGRVWRRGYFKGLKATAKHTYIFFRVSALAWNRTVSFSHRTAKANGQSTNLAPTTRPSLPWTISSSAIILMSVDTPKITCPSFFYFFKGAAMLAKYLFTVKRGDEFSVAEQKLARNSGIFMRKKRNVTVAMMDRMFGHYVDVLLRQGQVGVSEKMIDCQFLGMGVQNIMPMMIRYLSRKKKGVGHLSRIIIESHSILALFEEYFFRSQHYIPCIHHFFRDEKRRSILVDTDNLIFNPITKKFKTLYLSNPSKIPILLSICLSSPSLRASITKLDCNRRNIIYRIVQLGVTKCLGNILYLLIRKYGLDVNHVDRNGRSVGFFCQNYKQLEILALFGLNLILEDHYGKNCVDYITDRYLGQYFSILCQIKGYGKRYFLNKFSNYVKRQCRRKSDKIKTILYCYRKKMAIYLHLSLLRNVMDEKCLMDEQVLRIIIEYVDYSSSWHTRESSVFAERVHFKRRSYWRYRIKHRPIK